MIHTAAWITRSRITVGKKEFDIHKPEEELLACHKDSDSLLLTAFCSGRHACSVQKYLKLLSIVNSSSIMVLAVVVIRRLRFATMDTYQRHCRRWPITVHSFALHNSSWSLPVRFYPSMSASSVSSTMPRLHTLLPISHHSTLLPILISLPLLMLLFLFANIGCSI